jgi:uncharacterized membrane protein (UPF0182 family)
MEVHDVANLFNRRSQSTGPDPQPARASRARRGFRLSASTKRSLIILLVLVVIFAVMWVTAPFWINWIWFGSVGYRSVISTNYTMQALAFFVAALVAGLLFLVNVRLALRNTTRHDVGEDNRLGRASNSVLRWLSLAAAAVVAFTAGSFFSSRWQEILLAFNASEFGVEDPTFGRDVGFYVFQLPFLEMVQGALLALLIVTILAVAIIYLIRMGIRFRTWGDVPMVALRHLSALLAAVLLILAFNYVLNNFELVYSSRGLVNGPGFTDVNIVRPLNWLMAIVSALVGIGLLSGFVLRQPRYLVGLLGTWLVLAVLVTPLLPLAVQRVLVEPNEFSREAKYIERNIEMTQQGFGLHDVETMELTGQDPINASQLQPGEEPLSNVRIWDYRVVGPVYQQLQAFRAWYEFPDMDVARYTIDGQTVQVIVGVRELNIDGLEQNRQTWTNTRLVYTHGYGVVVSPVSEVGPDGWPVYIVNGIDPISAPPELQIDRPEIYFGETDMQWVILHTDQSETSGLREPGDDNATYEFEGEVYGSIGLGNPITRGMAALTLGDRNVFLSSQLTGDSRLVETRNVVERAERIAPFLQYDSDPYMVVADGRLYWIIDAFTETNAYPQATSYDGRNYMRNSAKVVVDAYNGETTFYRTDVHDPIADAWGGIYTDLFTPVSEAPESISAHFRYPEELFVAQSTVWGDYHMNDARTWYDGDDRWRVARETSEGEENSMEPYFVNQVLPGETNSSFALTIPFTPAGSPERHNMTAWFAGTADRSGNTVLREYEYPRQITVYGPRQIEAQIDQDPDISQQITLWGQGGSEVIRGNMLVIPINDAMLYVQPLYLQASGTSASAPRLARVIVAANDQVVMRPTLGEAIQALEDPGADTVDQIEENPDVAVEQAAGETPVSGATPVPGESSVDRSNLPADLAGMSDQELAQEALATLERAEQARLNLDSEAYNEELGRLQVILEALSGGDGLGPAATPAATPAS